VNFSICTFRDESTEERQNGVFDADREKPDRREKRIAEKTTNTVERKRTAWEKGEMTR